MFDILAFLFEQYFSLDNCPDRGTLAKQLAAAGFDDEDISEAMNWLKEFDELDLSPYAELDKAPRLPRLLHPREAARLTPEAQAMFHYLSTDALSNAQREMLVDRLLQSSLYQIDDEAVKRVALMLLWRQGDDLSNLLIEELLFGEHDLPMH